MAYTRKGMGEVVPIPLSAWGITSLPCTLGAQPVITGDVRCGTADSTTSMLDSLTSSPTMTLGIFAVAALGLYAIFGGDR